MLFLHAVLFSLLGMSALAIPVPFLQGLENEALNHVLKEQINGVWRSELRLREDEELLHAYKVVKITDGDSAEVLSAAVPTDDKAKKEDFLVDFFPPGSGWIRIRSLAEYQGIVGPDAAEQTIPEVTGQAVEDRLTIQFWREELTTSSYLAINLNEKTDESFKIRNVT